MIPAHIENEDYRAMLAAERDGARGAFMALRTVLRAVGTIYGDPLGMLLDRRIEAAQERYEDALSTADRLIQQLDKRLSDEVPF